MLKARLVSKEVLHRCHLFLTSQFFTKTLLLLENLCVKEVFFRMCALPDFRVPDLSSCLRGRQVFAPRSLLNLHGRDPREGHYPPGHYVAILVEEGSEAAPSPAPCPEKDNEHSLAHTHSHR